MHSLTCLFLEVSSTGADVAARLDADPEWSVRTVANGAEAIDAVEDGAVDLLVYRDGLRIDGEELLREARRRDGLLPAIALTDGAVTSDDERRERPTATVRIDRPDAVERVLTTIGQIVRAVRGAWESRAVNRRELLEYSHDCVYLLDHEWRFRYLNERAEAVLQLTDDVIGRRIWDVFPEASETMFAEEVTRAVESGDAVAFEVYYEPLDSWFRVSAYPAADGLWVFFQDVTDRLLQTRAMDAATIGIVITDPHREDDPIIYANHGFEAITGYAAEEILGRNCRFLQGVRTRSEPVDRMREAIAAREPVSVELINYRKNGTPFWNQIQITPVFDAVGELTHFIGFQQDVTDRVEEERRAQVLDRVLRHNLRNSMNVILGQLSVLEETGALDDEQLAPMVEHGTDLLRIAGRARDIDAVLEREQFEPTALALDDLVSRAVDAVGRSQPETSIDVEVPESLRVVASSALAVALEELFARAVAGGSDVDESVTVRTEMGCQHVPPEGIERPVVHLTVTNWDPALTDQEVAALTREAETPLRHDSGLGFWLVQWVVTMVGGSITVEESGDGRTAVTVTVLSADETVA